MNDYTPDPAIWRREIDTYRQLAAICRPLGVQGRTNRIYYARRRRVALQLLRKHNYEYRGEA